MVFTLDLRKDVSALYAKQVDWGKVFPNANLKYNINTAGSDISVLEKNFSESFRIFLGDSSYEDLRNSIELIAYTILRLGDVGNLDIIKERCLFYKRQLPGYEHDLTQSIFLLEYAIFSCLQWKGEKDHTAKEFEQYRVKMISLFNKKPELLYTPLNYHFTNRCLDLLGFNYVNQMCQMLDPYLKRLLHSENIIIYGIESRQWAFQFLELQRIFHIFQYLSVKGHWEKVKDKIYLIAIEGYCANHVASLTFCEKTGIRPIRDIHTLRKIIECQNSNDLFMPNQYSICCDSYYFRSIIGSQQNLHSCKTSLNLASSEVQQYDLYREDSGIASPFSIKWLFVYQFSFKRYPYTSLLSFLIHTEQTFPSDSIQSNDAIISICFKDIFRHEQSAKKFKGYRGKLLCPNPLIKEIIKYLLTNTRKILLFANDYFSKDDVFIKELLSNELLKKRIIWYDTLGKDKNEARINCLKLIDRCSSLSIGDLNGCHDVVSAYTQNSIFIGHSYPMRNLLSLNNKGFSSKKLEENVINLNQNIHFVDTYSIFEKSKIKDIPAGTNSHHIDNYFVEKSQEDILIDFQNTLQKILESN